jgi:signal transduction histidine kinase
MSNLIRNLKKTKNELNRIALVRSEEMNDLKTYFFIKYKSWVANTLNAIVNLTDSISSEVEDETSKKMPSYHSSHSLLGSINDILDFSKLKKNSSWKTQFSPLKYWEFENNAEIQAKDKGLDRFSISNDVPKLVEGDENRLVQILNNVLSNAIKFTPAGNVNFVISLSKERE